MILWRMSASAIFVEWTIDNRDEKMRGSTLKLAIKLDLMLAVLTHYRLELSEIKRPRGHLHVQKTEMLLTKIVQAGRKESYATGIHNIHNIKGLG